MTYLLKLSRPQANCKTCGLHLTCKTPGLPAELNTLPDKTELVIIGEAPGQEEDARGRPFIGRSGQLLRRMLQVSGLSARPYAILNAVNCRPQDNRTPRLAEIKSCSPLLEKRLSRLPNCRLILCLGKTAARSLLGVTNPLDNLRVTPLSHKNIPVIVTYHPAAVLRERDRLRVLWEDITRARLLLSGRILWKSNNITVNEAWTELQEEGSIKFTEDTLAFDIETTGLSLASDRVISASISQSPYVGTFFLKEKAGWDQLRDLLASKTDPLTLVGHNLVFDASFMSRNEGVDLTHHKWFDTRIAYAVLYPEQRRTSLKIIGPVLTRVPYPFTSEMVNKEYLETGSFENLMKYNALDTGVTYRLYQMLNLELIATKRKPVFDFVCNLAKLASVMQANGVHIDRAKLTDIKSELETTLLTLETRLCSKMGGDIHSDKAKLEYIFGESGLNLKARQFTAKKGQPSLAEGHLSELPDPTGFISQYLEWSKTGKFLSTYIKNLIESLTPDDMAYPHYNVVRSEEGGTVTGRITMTDPPIQTFPRKYHSLINSRFGDRGKIKKADLSQIELRVVADLAKDSMMLDAYLSNTDLHRQTGSVLFKKKIKTVTDEERQIAKTCNFAMVYGCTPEKLQEILRTEAGVNIGLSDAKQFIVRFYKAHRPIERWQENTIAFALEHGYGLSPTGRIRYFPDIGTDSKEGRSDRRAAINFPVQSGAADIASMGMYELWRATKNDPIYLIANIYDAILSDVRLDYIEDYVTCIKDIYETPGLMSSLGWKPLVPIKIEVDE